MKCFAYRLTTHRCMNIARNPRACFCGVVWATQTTNHFVGKSEEGEGSGVRLNTQLDQRRNPTFEATV